MNTKDNQRSRLTKMLMKQAFVALMHEKKPNKITVKDICEKAEINRSTFYLHFGEPNDVLKELEDDAISAVSGSLSSIGSLEFSTVDAKKYLSSFLKTVRKNDELFRMLLVENKDLHFRIKLHDVANEMIERSFVIPMQEDKRRLTYMFIVSGSINLLYDWIAGGYETSENDMCEILYLLSECSLRSACEKYII